MEIYCACIVYCLCTLYYWSELFVLKSFSSVPGPYLAYAGTPY